MEFLLFLGFVLYSSLERWIMMILGLFRGLTCYVFRFYVVHGMLGYAWYISVFLYLRLLIN
jgi:hypothetical protein